MLGGRDAPQFNAFADLACSAYNLIRPRLHLLVSLLSLMIPARMPELSNLDDINHLVAQLNPSFTDEEATVYFQNEITACLDSKFKRFDNTIHLLAHS